MGTSSLSFLSISTEVLLSLLHSLEFAPFKYAHKIKMMQSLIFVLLAVAGAHATSTLVTSSGVDLAPIYEFLDNDEDGMLNAEELDALTKTGDGDGNGEVTAEEFQATWENLAAAYNFPAERHAHYFGLVDGVDGSAKDGVIKEAENVALFAKFDEDKSGKISKDEFLAKINSVLS